MPSVSFSNNSLSVKKLDESPLSPCFGLRYSAWEEELCNDIDRDFILDGIKHGFDIIDKNAQPTPVHCENHASAKPGSPLYNKATEQILNEIGMGNYVVVSEPPDIISPMGVIAKPDGGFASFTIVRNLRASRLMITALQTGSSVFLEWKMQQI